MSVRNTENEIKEVKEKIKAVEGKIEAVEEEIKEVKEEIKAETDADERKALRKKEEQLRDKEKQLNERLNNLLSQQQQLQLQQPPNVLDAGELEKLVACSALSQKFLKFHDLENYVVAAAAAKVDTQPILQKLSNFQKERKSRVSNSDWCARFTCVLLSSGAGKTQLAATAALNSPSATKVVYLCLDEGDPNFSQKFYKPHRELANMLRESLGNTRSALTGLDFASSILSASRRPQLDANNLLVRLISMILFGEEVGGLNAVRSRIFKSETTFLVFIDEFPPRGERQQDEAYANAVLLRNTFRAIGIAPIVMGTHLSANNAVGGGSREDCKDGSDQHWVVVVTELPRYKLTEEQKGAHAFLLDTDRPLVLHWALDNVLSNAAVTEQERLHRLGEIVAHVRRRLQQNKASAWQVKSGCQLLQLFRLKEIGINSFDNTHALIGAHFGKLLLGQFREFDRREVKTEMEAAPMCLVSPEQEPLLHLALVTWDCSMLGKQKPGNYFPLADSGHAVSVKRAFVLNKQRFQFQATIDNPPAKKLCGDRLEVVVHAALSLASMKTDSKSFLGGVPLFDYITCSAVLMKEVNQLDMGAFNVDQLFWGSLSDTYKNMRIPAFGACDSPLHGSLRSMGAQTGLLTRPADSVNVDGLAYGSENQHLFQVECKNYSDGVDKSTCDKIFQRIKSKHSVAFVFVSALKDQIYSKSNWDIVRKGIKACKKTKAHPHPAFLSDNVSIAIVDTRQEQHELSWMKIGSVEIKKGTATELLIVIFQVGKVD